jgi:hypothetical protein
MNNIPSDPTPGQPDESEPRDNLSFIYETVAGITDAEIEERLRRTLQEAGYSYTPPLTTEPDPDKTPGHPVSADSELDAETTPHRLAHLRRAADEPHESADADELTQGQEHLRVIWRSRQRTRVHREPARQDLAGVSRDTGLRLQARRAGLQPVLVIDGTLPPSASVVVARVVWRYRTEIAPILAAGTVFAAGWWLHQGLAHQWQWILWLSALTAWALIPFGARLGVSRLADRTYAAASTLAAGGWLATATLHGPLTPPLPLIFGAGALIFAVPWWVDRRRRARARVQRMLATWPDIARAIGLPGSVIQSASLDQWGWHARVRLASGQTINDVIARIPAIESALGTIRGAVSVYPADNGRSDWCELRVLGTDSTPTR